MREKIKLGDIIVFDGTNDWLSKTICLMTNSTVSHAAMIYSNHEIVEMEHKGILVSPFRISKGSKAHLLRLTKEQPTEPIILAARKYVEEGIKYDFPALVLLAGLIIYRNVLPTPRFQKITDLVLTGACFILDQFLNSLLHKEKPVKTMICSQLVYQIYLDCGKEYKIQIKDILGNHNFKQYKETIKLVDLAKGQNGMNMHSVSFKENSFFDKIVDEQLLIKELCLALTEWQELDEIISGVDIESTLQKVSTFIGLLEKILAEMQLDIPVPALFITPADLYERAFNLRKVCDFDLIKI